MKRARDAGAAAVVTKPILPNELVEVVRQCCPPPEAGTRTRRRRLAD
jgi:hypothetical protein